MNIILKRRSFRTFQGRAVEMEKIEKATRAGMQAPSVHNFRPWEFLVIDKSEAIVAVSEMSPYAKFAKNAKALIMVICDFKR